MALSEDDSRRMRLKMAEKFPNLDSETIDRAVRAFEDSQVYLLTGDEIGCVLTALAVLMVTQPRTAKRAADVLTNISEQFAGPMDEATKNAILAVYRELGS